MYTYNVIDESGYIINSTLVLRQPVLCLYYDNSNTSNDPHLYDICDTINLNISSGDSVFTYVDNSSTTHSVTNNYHIKYNTTVMTNESGTYTFILKCDGICTMTIDGQKIIDLTKSGDNEESSQRFSVNLVANTYYPVLIEYDKYTGDSLLQLYWIKPGQSTEELVPTENLWFDQYYGGQRRELNITLPDEYKGSYANRRILNHARWGDGMKTGNEQWDDNNTNTGDGCSSTCKVEKGYICKGGNAGGSDTWVRCPVGYKSGKEVKNTDYTGCIPETDNHDIIYYIIVALLSIGMIKYFVKDFIRVNELDKSEDSDKQVDKHEEKKNGQIEIPQYIDVTENKNNKTVNIIEFHR